MRATQVLHCNLNVTELTSASALYERALGLDVRMRSESVDGDSTPLGIDGPTHSIAWFLYDHRGGHVSPAVELVEWIEPVTAGAAYADPTAVGMQSLIFATPSPAECRAALLDAGATDASPAEVFDRDGVRIELVGDSSALAATLVGLRLSCTDLEASVEWYGHLGWEPTRGRETTRRSAPEAHGTTQRIALPTHPFEIHLTAWASNRSPQRAHQDANTRGLFRMALAVDDVRAACDEARAEGAVAVGEPTYIPLPGTPLGGLWVSFFRDPNGVMVELVERATGRR